MSRIGALAETLLMLGEVLDPMPADDRRLVLGWLTTAYGGEEAVTSHGPAAPAMPKPEPPKESNRALVLGALRECSPATALDVSTRTGLEPARVKHTLRDMFKKSLVVRTGRGLYAHTDFQ